MHARVELVGGAIGLSKITKELYRIKIRYIEVAQSQSSAFCLPWRVSAGGEGDSELH